MTEEQKRIIELNEIKYMEKLQKKIEESEKYLKRLHSSRSLERIKPVIETKLRKVK